MPKSIDRNTQARIASELEKRSAQSRTPLTDGIDTTTRNAPTQYPFNVRELKKRLVGWRGRKREGIHVRELAADMSVAGYQFPSGKNSSDIVQNYIGRERVFEYKGLLSRRRLTITSSGYEVYSASVD